MSNLIYGLTRRLPGMALSRALAAWLRTLLPLLALTLTTQALAQFDYTSANGQITITRYTGPGGALIIPATLDGLPVTRIAERAFFKNGGLASVILPDSLVFIGPEAFHGCAVLTAVNISAQITTIENGAFSNCSKLAAMTVDAANPSYLSVDGVLFNKSGTVLVQYPPGKAAADYSIPDGVVTVGHDAFYGARNLGSLAIPNSVRFIEKRAFYLCTGIANLALPSGLTSIADQAFAICTKLTAIHIPDNVSSVGEATFIDSFALASVTVGEANAIYSSEDGVLFDKSKSTLLLYPPAKPSVDYSIPDGVTAIADEAFYNNSPLATIRLPDNLASVPKRAFLKCENLASISVRSANSSFSTADGVLFNKAQTELIRYPIKKAGRAYVIPNGVATVAEQAFYGCYYLAEITIPGTVKSIGYQAFNYSPFIANITVDAANSSYASVDGILFDKAMTTIIRYPQPKTNSVYTLPNTITSIGDGAFVGCFYLTSFVIPDRVTSIGNRVFAYCGGLTNVTMPNSVTAIGESAFSGCSRIKRISIPRSVTSIGDSAFSGCTLLDYIELPEGVTSIGRLAFSGCGRLRSATIPSTVTMIGERAFLSCTLLERVYFLGNAPSWEPEPFSSILRTVAYYPPNRIGWASTFARVRTVQWNPTALAIRGGLGLQAGKLTFAMVGDPSIFVTVESCDDLANPNWTPLKTYVLSAGGTAHFDDSEAASHPGRIYRVVAR